MVVQFLLSVTILGVSPSLVAQAVIAISPGGEGRSCQVHGGIFHAGHQRGPLVGGDSRQTAELDKGRIDIEQIDRRIADPTVATRPAEDERWRPMPQPGRRSCRARNRRTGPRPATVKVRPHRQRDGTDWPGQSCWYGCFTFQAGRTARMFLSRFPTRRSQNQHRRGRIWEPSQRSCWLRRVVVSQGPLQPAT